MGFLDALLAPKKRMLLVVTEQDIDAMSAAQKREYGQKHVAVALLSRGQSERISTYGGLVIACQFQRMGALKDAIAGWDIKPEIIRVSSKLPQASLIDGELTRAFLDTETTVHDFATERTQAGYRR